MSYSLSHIAEIIGARCEQGSGDRVIEYLVTDSRRILFPDNSLFFALPGHGRSGAGFIEDAFEKGIRSFVTAEEIAIKPQSDTVFLKVSDVLAALQELATVHRGRFNYPVIGITGSNGKTIIKEWFAQIAGATKNIVRNPGSYNSQVGVALSVWRMQPENDLAVFEAGISQPGEMDRLREMIAPDIGLLSFVGSAHAEGFSSLQEKIREKLQLFTQSKLLVYNHDQPQVGAEVLRFKAEHYPYLRLFSRSRKSVADLQLIDIKKVAGHATLHCRFQNSDFAVDIPFDDEASVDNALSCISLLLACGFSPAFIVAEMPKLRPVEMRLQLKKGRENNSIINDSYNADLHSLTVSLDFLDQQTQHARKVVILSDLLQQGRDERELYETVARILLRRKPDLFVGVGSALCANGALFNRINAVFFPDTDSLIRTLPQLDVKEAAVLLKGARVFHFETISRLLEEKLHETFLTIDLDALRHNVKVYRQELLPGVKIMAMVKAFGYGSGSQEPANALVQSGVDYLAVAYADEGTELKKRGVKVPIMVMNPEASGFERIVRYGLEPEIYSLRMLQLFREFLQRIGVSNYPVHLKVDTGMNRLGFDSDQIDDLLSALKVDDVFEVRSVFSHLAASDDMEFDAFTEKQFFAFNAFADALDAGLGKKILRHISNSGGVRSAEWQLGMVRAGIGLYGISSDEGMQHKLRPVSKLSTTISQIRKIAAGETVGYNRKGMVQRDSVIATVRIGYADGYPRSLSNGAGLMIVNGLAAPVIGNICMDMTMLDITGIDAEEGDEVVVFGEELPVQEIARRAGTIPYEILTNISQRVKRVYVD